MFDVHEAAADLDRLYPGRWALCLIRIRGLDADCPAPGKQPVDRGWNAKAMSRYQGPLTIREAWLEAMARWVGFRGNVGLALPPGVVALDVDDEVGGVAAWEAVEELLPAECPKQVTGRGAHFFLRVPDGLEVRGTSVGACYGRWPVTLRTLGNQVVVEPSVHIDRLPYEWERELPRRVADLPLLDPDLLSWQAGTGVDPYRRLGAVVDAPMGFVEALYDPDHVFPAGQRHNAALHAAAHMHAAGIVGRDLGRELEAFATHRLEGGLPERELRAIVDWFRKEEER